MAQVPPNKRLLVEDFPDQAEWIGPMLQILNEFMEQTNYAFNRQLTVNENMLAQIQTFDVTGGSLPVSFKYNLAGKVVGCFVIKAVENVTNPTALTTAVWASWTQTTQGIRIDALSGLTAGVKYKVTVVVLGG